MPEERLAEGDAILVVEMQPDFCPGGALPVTGGDRILPVLNEWLGAARRRGIPVYASRDWHPPGHASFRESGGPWPAHCVQDTPGAAYHPGLALPADAVLVCKGTRLDRDQYSAFDETGLAAHMRGRGIRRVWVGGLALDVCVRASVLDGLREGFDVYLIPGASRPVDPEDGREAVLEMRRAGAVVEGE